MKPAWLFRPQRSTCAGCGDRLFGAWMVRAAHADHLYCRTCAIAVLKITPPPFLNWPGWSQFKTLEHNRPHNRLVGVSR